MHTENYGLMEFVFERLAVYVYICVYIITMATKILLEVYKSHIYQLEADPSENAQNISQIDAWFNLLYNGSFGSLHGSTMYNYSVCGLQQHTEQHHSWSSTSEAPW